MERFGVLPVKVIQLLLQRARLHMLEMLLTSGNFGQEQLLGPLQLDLTDALLHLPENPP